MQKKSLGFEPQKAAYYLEKTYENGHRKPDWL